MSVRVAYLSRGPAGVGLRGLRLVGPSTDESLSPGVEGELEHAAAAVWTRDRLREARGSTSLAALCLDAEGSLLAWVASPTRDASAVAALARMGPSSDDATGSLRGTAAAIAHVAGDALSSSVEPLAADVVAPAPRTGLSLRRAPKPETGAQAEPSRASERLAVLVSGDVEGRLVIDALDAAGVGVDSAVSIWHAMTQAWDPAAKADSGPAAAIHATILTDDAGRLLWSWSRGGELLAGGALRVARRDAAAIEPTPADAARLTHDWLAWSAQLGQAPTRVVAILHEVEAAQAFGAALSRSWPTLAVDLIRAPDPVGATLRRYAEKLETSPAPSPEGSGSTRELATLSSRPGRLTRSAYLWGSAAILALAGCAFFAALDWRSQASSMRSIAAGWDRAWREPVGREHPEVMRPQLGKSPLAILREEIARRERDLRPAERPGALTMPVLSELDTLSLILGDPTIKLESITLDSELDARFSIVVDDLSIAEGQVLESLRGISGSSVVEWRLARSTRVQEGDRSRVRAEYEATWDPRLRQPSRPGGRS